MAKRGTHYVYLEGDIYRLTDRQYIQYLAANCSRYTPVSQHGTYVGCGINVTNYTTPEFRDELDRARKASVDSRSLPGGK